MASYKLSAAQKRDLLRKNFTKEEIEHLELQMDPVVWAESFLKDPENPGKPLKCRFFQAEMLRCKTPKKVYRCGRRVGKSVVLCIEMIWKAFCNNDKRILVCAPYKTQVQQLWKDGFHKLIKGNEFIEASISRMSSNPYTIEFKNGSRIMGLTAGSKSGNKGTSIRGQSADDLYLDEVDYMGDEAIQSIMAIVATKQDTRFVISSTPTGRREFFYNACTNKTLGYEEFHFASNVSPEWISIEQAKERGLPLHKSQEYLFRNSNPEHIYQHEYEAEFGEEAQGVFKHEFLDRSLISYDPEKEDIEPRGRYWYCGAEQTAGNVYAMGVDWNGEKVGTQIVITEYFNNDTDVTYREDVHGNSELTTAKMQGKYRVFYRESVSRKEMTQTESIRRIIELNKRFKINHIYVDAGFGTTNIEELKLYGMKFRESGILEKLVAIDFASSVMVFDPYTKQQQKKAMKPFMVFNAVNCLERSELILPEAEDEKVKLVGQMREYIIEKISPLGVPTFSHENDHILDAFILSLLAYQMEYSELVKVKNSHVIAFSKKPSLLLPGVDRVGGRDLEVKDKVSVTGVNQRASALDADSYHQKSPEAPGSHVDYGDLMKDKKKTNTPFGTTARRTGWSRVGAPSRRMF